jgi:hypothetical protein
LGHDIVNKQRDICLLPLPGLMVLADRFLAISIFPPVTCLLSPFRTIEPNRV